MLVILFSTQMGAWHIYCPTTSLINNISWISFSAITHRFFSIFLIAMLQSTVWLYHCLLYQYSIGKHLCCFQIYILITNASINIMSIYLGKCREWIPRREIVGSKEIHNLISLIHIEKLLSRIFIWFNSSTNRLIRTSLWMSVAICQPAFPTTTINNSFRHWKGLY